MFGCEKVATAVRYQAKVGQSLLVTGHLVTGRLVTTVWSSRTFGHINFVNHHLVTSDIMSGGQRSGDQTVVTKRPSLQYNGWPVYETAKSLFQLTDSFDY